MKRRKHIRRKHSLRITLLAILSAVFLAGGSVSYGASYVSSHNTFQTGAVNITLNECHKDADGNEVPYDNSFGENILPGQEISKIARITNLAASCYVRTRIVCGSDDKVWNLGVSDIEGISKDWISMPDGYFYLRKPMETGQSADLFTGVVIPQSIPQETMEGKNFTVRVEAEAIQEKNFMPDYSSDNPWGDVKILSYAGSDDYSVSEVASSDKKTFTLKFDDGVSSIALNNKDFFSNIPVLMPGDTYSDTLKLKNDSKTTQKVYFWADSPSDNALSGKVNLRIERENDGKTEEIYNGRADLNTIEQTELVQLKKGEEASLLFTVSLPEEADNSVALQDGYVNWHFTSTPKAESKTRSASNGKDGKDGNNGRISSSDTGGEQISVAGRVQTGFEDYMPFILLSVGIGLAIVTFAAAYREKSRQRLRKSRI